MNCNCQGKPHAHNVVYNLNRNLWAIGSLATEKLQIKCLKRHIMSLSRPNSTGILKNVYEAYRRNEYVPTTIELTLISL